MLYNLHLYLIPIDLFNSYFNWTITDSFFCTITIHISCFEFVDIEYLYEQFDITVGTI